MTPRLPTAAQIEALLTSPGNAPGLTGREIADALRIPPALRSRLRQALRDWVVEGRLVALRGRRFGARSALGDVVGRYSRHPAGASPTASTPATPEANNNSPRLRRRRLASSDGRKIPRGMYSWRRLRNMK